MNKEQTEALIQRAVEVDPDYIIGFCQMTSFAAGKGDLDEAERWLEPIREQESFHTSEFAALCRAHIDLELSRGRMDAARFWLQMWEDVAPYDPHLPISMTLTFRSKLVRDQRFSPKIAGSRTRLEQKLAALSSHLAGQARAAWPALMAGRCETIKEVPMAYQECALYGALVRYLRDRCAERQAELDPASDIEAARAWLDDLIRDWFFTPQHDLHGDAPRDIIWREQKGEPNVVPPDRMDDLFFDDCPVCQAMRDDPGEWHWHYDDGGFPLIAEYDPEGWDERWEAEHEAFERWRAEQGDSERWETEEFLGGLYGFPDATPEQEAHIRAIWGLPTTEEEEAIEPSEIPVYDPPPALSRDISPAELWLRAAEEPWLDRELHDAARALAGRLGFSVPNPPLTLQRVDLGWHRLTFPEALPLVAGLHDRGVDMSAFLEQVRAFPYQDISLEWLIAPERCMATMTGVLENDVVEEDPVSAARLRHDREFIERVSRLIPLHARIWLRGWSDALTHAAFAQAVEWDDELPF